MPEYDFKIINSDEELKEYFKIRNDIFVKEQNIFPESDIDDYDKDAIHIAAVQNSTGKMVGAVRCYNTEGDTWKTISSLSFVGFINTTGFFFK